MEQPDDIELTNELSQLTPVKMHLTVGRTTEEPVRNSEDQDDNTKVNNGSLPAAAARERFSFWKCMRPSKSSWTASKWKIAVQHGLIIILLPLLLWGILYAAVGDSAAPGGNVFALGLLFGAAAVAGPIVALARLPPLLGMLIMGIFLRNVGFFSVSGAFIEVVGVLRKMAMVVILTKGGLGLDSGALRRLSFVVLRLAFFPCLAEAATVCIASHFLLGFPWLWGALLGFILAAVSPAVVVPSLLNLKESGYGEDKGISTLVIAASSIDDIVAISAFGIVLGTIFSEGSLSEQILHGPLEVIIGLSFGIGWGMLTGWAVPKDEPKTVYLRSMLVGGGGLFAVLASQAAGYDGAGPLACITAAFVASTFWKHYEGSEATNPVAATFSDIWLIFQPVLFGLIGTEVKFSEIQPETLSYGFAVLIIGLMVRVIVCLVVTQGGVLNFKEIIFVAIAWFPKATVQAAFGPVALDIARKKYGEPLLAMPTNSTLVEETTSVELDEGSTYLSLAAQVLTVAVLSILVTAPLGAIGIAFSGPHLLHKRLETTNVNTSPGRNNRQHCNRNRETATSIP